MHQSVDKEIVQAHKEAEAGHAGDHAVKGVANLILHKVAFQPVGDVARGLVSAALRHGTVLTQLQHLLHLIVVAAGRRGVTFHLAFGLRQQIFNGAVQQQVGITTDRRGKVRV